MNKELKPCPFCGCGEDDIDIQIVGIMEDIIINKTHYKIEFVCTCGVILPTKTIANSRKEAIEKAIEAWNRRVNDEILR